MNEDGSGEATAGLRVRAGLEALTGVLGVQTWQMKKVAEEFVRERVDFVSSGGT